jgi:hypothetical protein
VISALGAIYGIALGTLIGTVGPILNGVAGYLLMSTPVRRVIERALKGRSPEAIAALSHRAGPWGIALSRSLPDSIPGAMVCLAGLARMPVKALPRLAWFWQHHPRRCSPPGSALAGLGIPSLRSRSAICSRLPRYRRCPT